MLLILILSVLIHKSSATTTKSPQQITWFYVNDLTTGAEFFKETLQLNEVTNLIQQDKCRIFHTTDAPSTYLGVCNTRPAPDCQSNSNGNSVPSTYTFVASSKQGVDSIHSSLSTFNNSKLILTSANGSPNIWGAYGFNFYDINYKTGLGCYRFEVQYFTDTAWKLDTYAGLIDQLKSAGNELYKEPIPSVPVQCKCEDFCSGRCFAPSCQPCLANVWNGGGEASCVSAGPLGEGLLCSQPIEKEMPCCEPNGTTCSIVGGAWCDCTKYPKEIALFPSMLNRMYSKNGTCIEQ